MKNQSSEEKWEKGAGRRGLDRFWRESRNESEIIVT